MIEERQIELIHAELDGELTSEQRAELSRLLLANPEARALRAQLSRLFGDLAKLEDVAPPPELAASILDATDRPATRGPAWSPHRSWFTGRAFRYAAVFVGGLLVTALLFGRAAKDAAGPDVSELVGTIGGHGVRGHGSPIDQLKLDLAQVRGVVNSYQVDGQLVVELDLAANEPVEVVAKHAGQAVHVSLEKRPDATPERVVWLPTRQGEADEGIELQVYGGDRLIYRDTLRASAGRSE